MNQDALGAMSITPITPTSTAIAFTSPSTAGASVGAPATVSITTSGGPVPYLTESGSLDGLSFQAQYGGSATISGVPTAPGVFPIRVKASNGMKKVTENLTLTVTTPIRAAADGNRRAPSPR